MHTHTEHYAKDAVLVAAALEHCKRHHVGQRLESGLCTPVQVRHHYLYNRLSWKKKNAITRVWFGTFVLGIVRIKLEANTGPLSNSRLPSVIASYFN